ncbi:MAG: hypothetical protein K5649_01420 [Lachnospiraceae bacterium]|nr:hypothetical protein [Lachnospiraceae bacterium]
MKKYNHWMLLICLFTCFALLAGCGKAEDDPNAGTYVGTSAEAFGTEMDIEDFYEGGVSIELNGGGKGKMYLGSDDFKIKWELDGDDFHASGSGADLDGTLSDGVLYLEDMMGMGVNMTLVCDELANGGDGEDGGVSGSVLQRLKDAHDGKDVYTGGDYAGYDDTDDWDIDMDGDGWDTEADGADDAGEAANVELSEYAIARDMDPSMFGEGVADAETLAEFYYWWANELESKEKDEYRPRFMEVAEERIGCRPKDAMTDNDDLDRAEFEYETPEGDGSLLILFTRRDGEDWSLASLSPGGEVYHAVKALEGE